jgi:hypothetical protein
MNPLAETLRTLAAALERLGIPYAIGGSLASAARGLYRATNDADLVAAIQPHHANLLPATLGPQWYADADQIREALRTGRSFNLVFLPFSQKVDIFPATGEFHSSQLRRATKEAPFRGEEARYPITSEEDILLAKLRWYKDGGETSDRQWQDIMGIVAVNPSLDLEYLRTWADRLGVDSLLTRALTSNERLP